MSGFRSIGILMGRSGKTATPCLQRILGKAFLALISLFFTFIFSATPLTAQAQSAKLKELEQRLKTESAEERCRIYPFILDEVYSNTELSDKYRALYLKDAESVGRVRFIADACQEISHSYNYDLVVKALTAMNKVPKNQWTQPITTLLRCHKLWGETASMDKKQREAELTAIRKQIYKQTFGQNPYEDYYNNFKAYMLHGAQSYDAPLGPYVRRMYQIAQGLNNNEILTIHATLLASDLSVRYSEFKAGMTLNQRLLELYEKRRERLRQNNRIRGLDVTDCRAAMRLMICIFEVEHRVDSLLMEDLLNYWKQDSQVSQMGDRFFEMQPIYYAILQKRMDDAVRLVQGMEEKHKEPDFMYDFEYDAAVTVYWKTGQHDKAIELTNTQIERYKKSAQYIDQQFLQEMGLNEEWQDVDRQNHLLQAEQEANAYETQNYKDTLMNLIAKHKADSIAFADIQQAKREGLKHVRTQDSNSTRKAKTEKHNLSTSLRIGFISLGVVTLLMLIILVPYMLRLRKLNKKLTAEHNLLRKTADKANQSNKLKVFFLQNTSHDIRNPLGAISNMSKMMYDMVSLNKDEDMMECAKLVNENSVLLNRMMSNILDISAIESGRHPILWEECYPIGLAQDIVMAKNANKDKPIEVYLETDLPDDYMLRSDNKRLKQLLTLLFNNAWKFTEEGYIKIKMHEEHGKLVIEVEDTGRGIPADKSTQIFQRFYKIDEFVPGTGMGLSLCKVISDNLFGELFVDTTYTNGARFVFKHPLEAEKENTNETNAVRSTVSAILLFFASILSTQAQSTPTAIFDSIRHEAEVAPTQELRIQQYKNLMDHSMSRLNDSINIAVEKLYELGKKMGRNDVMLEAARNIASQQKKEEMLARIATIPNSEEKRCAVTYMRTYILTFKLFNKSAEEKKEWIEQTLKELQIKNITDPYERYYTLYGLCYASMGVEQSEIITSYLDELIELAPKLHSPYNYLCTTAYQTGYTCYLSLNKKEKAVATINRLLRAIDEMEKQYRKEGRIFRDFTRFRVRYYTDMYFCQSVLTKEQKQHCYEEIKSLLRKRPDILDEQGLLVPKIMMVLDLHEGRIQDAAKHANVFADQLDEVLYRPNTVLFGEELSVVHFDLLTKVYEQINDHENMLKIRIMLCELYRRTINNMRHYNYQHLNLRLQILDTELQNARMRAEQKRKVAEDNKLKAEIEKSQINSLKERHDNRMKAYSLDSTMLDTQKHLIFMQTLAKERQTKSSRIRQYMTIGAGLILLATIVSTIIITGRLRRRSKKLKRIKLRLSNELLRAKKSDEETTAFLKSIRHEVGTPLNIIMGMSQQISMMAEDKDSEEMKALSDIITENGETLLSLINDILNLSLIQSGEYNINAEDFDVRQLCDSIVASVQHHCPSGVDMHAEYTIAEGAEIKTDGVRFRQVLTNLFTNACKYTEAGSIILNVTQKQSSEYVFTVTDTGSGISSENAEAIFERFEKLGSQKQGTGLGLNISRIIATKLGGKLYLDTSYKGGARFVFTHPVECSEKA